MDFFPEKMRKSCSRTILSTKSLLVCRLPWSSFIADKLPFFLSDLLTNAQNCLELIFIVNCSFSLLSALLCRTRSLNRIFRDLALSLSSWMPGKAMLGSMLCDSTHLSFLEFPDRFACGKSFGFDGFHILVCEGSRFNS